MTNRDSLTRWSVGVVAAAVLGAAGWGLAADRSAVAQQIAEAKAVADKAAAGVASGNVERTRVAGKVDNLERDMDEVKESLKEIGRKLDRLIEMKLRERDER